MISVNEDILRQYGPIVAVLHGYLKANTKNGTLIGGVKCSPISVNTMSDAVGGLARNTIYKYLSVLSENGYIISSSESLKSPLANDIDKSIRANKQVIFVGVVKG